MAVDDPGAVCGNTSNFGGSFPIPEDWHDGSPAGFEDWFVLALSCDPLLNDNDPDGDDLTMVIDVPPSHGEALVLDDFGVAYRPDPDYSTQEGDWISDTIVYHAEAGGESSNQATIRLWVAAINDPPTVTAGGNVNVLEDSGPYSATWATDVLAGPPIEVAQGQTVSFVAQALDPGLFSVQPAIAPDGTLTFTPAPNVSGMTHIMWDLYDTGGTWDFGNGYEGSDRVSGSFQLSISPVNDPPTFTPGPNVFIKRDHGAYSAPWATAISPGPANESGQSVTFQVTDIDTQGNDDLFQEPPAIAPDGTLTFRAADGDWGNTYVTVEAVDDGGGSDDTSEPHTFFLHVEAKYPEAFDDEVTISEDDGPVVLDVTSNDLPSSPGDGVWLRSVTDPANGSASVTPSRDNVVYTPGPDVNGSDSFEYLYAEDDWESGNDADVGRVDITIVPVNDAPSFSAGADVAIDEDAGPQTVDGWATAISAGPGEAGQSLTFLVTANSNPALFAKAPAISATTGALTFTPAVNASGQAVLSLRLKDGGGTLGGGVNLSPPVTLTIDVGAVNDRPAADDETLTVAEDAAAVAVPVLTGDTDPDGPSPLAITARTNGAKGTVTITGGGTGLTYQPGANKAGTDTFTYTVSDGLLTDTATVSVTITPIQDPPTAVNDKLTVPEGAGATPVAVLANDTDLDGDVLRISTKTNGAKGVVAITGGGTGLTYDPGPLKSGTDTFTYTASDGHGGTDSATVVVTITPDTASPVVVAPSQRLPGQTLTSNATNTVKTDIAWSATDPGSGVASYQLQMRVDGGGYTTISLPTPTTTSVQRTLTFGRTYQFRVLATDGRGNRSPFVYGPALTPGRHQEDSSLATYVGTWTTTTNADMSGGKGRWASATAARARFTFTGRDVAWVTTKTTTSGRAQVWVDGTLITTVSLRSDPIKHRQVVFSRHWPTSGTHTVEIRPLGDGRVYIDAWVALR